MALGLAWYPCLYHRTWLPWECPTPRWVILTFFFFFFLLFWGKGHSGISLAGLHGDITAGAKKRGRSVREEVWPDRASATRFWIGVKQWIGSVLPDSTAGRRGNRARRLRWSEKGVLDRVAWQPCTGTPPLSPSAEPWMLTFQQRLKTQKLLLKAGIACMSSRSWGERARKLIGLSVLMKSGHHRVKFGALGFLSLAQGWRRMVKTAPESERWWAESFRKLACGRKPAPH